MDVSTRTKLVLAAERLLRIRGYSDFSYADLAEEVGIRKPSIHHYFRTKEELGSEVVREYLVRFNNELEQIWASKTSATSKLKAYLELFSGAAAGGTFPLCTALAAQKAALPARMQEQTVHFFQLHLGWLEEVIKHGKGKNELANAPDPATSALVILTILEGGAVVAWALSKPEIIQFSFEAVVESWATDSRQ